MPGRLHPTPGPRRPPDRPGAGARLTLVAAVAALALPWAPAPAAGQELPRALRFPAPEPVLLRAPLAGPDLPPGVRFADPDPDDPPPLGPPPPHHTRNAVLFTTGVSVGVFGVLLLLPESITGWSADDRSWDGMREEWSDFKRHVATFPVWDDDHWFFNYVGHPYVGMHTYLMERNYGMSPTRSFLFSTAASFAFEYAVEAWAEPPSMQDLLTTSPLGSILGEVNYRLTHHLRRGGLTFPEKALVTVVNPLHVIQHGYH